MKTSWIFGLVVVVIVIGGGLLIFGNKKQAPAPSTTTEQSSSAQGNNVEIKGFAYQPATLTVKAGTTVTWTNKDSVGHSATSDDGKTFDTGVFAQNETAKVTFNTPGTYNYHCTVHPSIKGTIVVEK